MKYWISKYALTRGIFEAECKIALSTYVFYNGNVLRANEYHETEESARYAADAMRTKKIASLRKQIERLEKMEF